MHKNKISAVITVLNGERTIKACLESIKWVDEIVVVDDGSTDKTLEIVKKYTDKIFFHKSSGYVEPTRNFAIGKAQGEWILLLDADEQVPQSLAVKLQELAGASRDEVCIRIPRKNIIFNKWMQHTGWWPDYNIRFFNKGSVIWSDKIHSQPEVKGSSIDLEPHEEYALIHYNYESISQFLHKLDSYTTITARERMSNKQPFAWTQILESPVQEFLSRYFARKGYKDGLHGLVLSLLMAFYEFVIALKIWEQKGFEEADTKDIAKDFEKIVKTSQKHLHFWAYDKKIEEETQKIKQQYLRFRRKLPI